MPLLLLLSGEDEQQKTRLVVALTLGGSHSVCGSPPTSCGSLITAMTHSRGRSLSNHGEVVGSCLVQELVWRIKILVLSSNGGSNWRIHFYCGLSSSMPNRGFIVRLEVTLQREEEEDGKEKA